MIMKKTIAILVLSLFGFCGLAQALVIRVAGASEMTPIMAAAKSDDVQPKK